MNCTCRIIGEGPARTEIEYAIRELGLQDVVRLVGAASTKDVASAMDWADVLLAPSVKEEFGVAILEAQSAGVPVVASRVGGIPEASREGVTSLLVEPRKPEELAAAVQQLVHDPEVYRSFSQEGPRFAEEFAVSRIGAQLIGLYEATIRNWQSAVNGGSRKATPLRPEVPAAQPLTASETQPVLVRRERSS
jgi:glycosyltransferase involved in cell wall biosynthesis